MDDTIRFQPATPRPPSRRVVLWDELEQLHAPLGMAPPTATVMIKDVEAEVERLRVQVAAEQHDEPVRRGSGPHQELTSDDA